MKWQEGHQKPFEEYVVSAVVLGLLAGVAYLVTGWPIVLPPTFFGYEDDLAIDIPEFLPRRYAGGILDGKRID